MTTDTFISHSSTDADFANRVCAALEKEGVTCWIAPRNVQGGEEYAASIMNGIKNTRLFVLVLSAAAGRSPQVSREVERAVSRNIPILTIRLDDEPLTDAMEYFLSSTQWVDASSGEVEKVVMEVVSDVRRFLFRPDLQQIPFLPPSHDVKTKRRRLSGGFIFILIITAVGLAYLAVTGLKNFLPVKAPQDPSAAEVYTEASQWPIAFADSYSTATSSVERTTDDEYIRESINLEDGVMRWRLLSKQSDGGASYSGSLEVNNDFLLTIDIKQVEGIEYSKPGIYLENPEKELYLLQISQSFRGVALYSFKDEVWGTLIEPVFTNVVLPAGETNHVEVILRNERFLIFVNGTFLTEYNGIKNITTVGMIGDVSTGDLETVTDFDNLSIRERSD